MEGGIDGRVDGRLLTVHAIGGRARQSLLMTGGIDLSGRRKSTNSTCYRW